MSVVERINDHIQSQGLKQKHLASRIGWSEKKLSAVLTGRRKLAAEELKLFCVALNAQPNDFIKPDYSITVAKLHRRKEDQ